MNRETIGTKKAIEMCREMGIHVSHVTLLSWCSKFNLGVQLGGKRGKWFIDAQKFKDFLIHGGADAKNEIPRKGNEKTGKKRNHSEIHGRQSKKST